jgi:hypothetical protein
MARAPAEEDHMGRSGRVLCQALCLALLAAEAPAQTPFPAKPIPIVVPYAPGGLTDVVPRLYAEQLRQRFGHGVVRRQAALDDRKAWLRGETASWKRDVEDVGIVVEE